MVDLRTASMTCFAFKSLIISLTLDSSSARMGDAAFPFRFQFVAVEDEDRRVSLFSGMERWNEMEWNGIVE